MGEIIKSFELVRVEIGVAGIKDIDIFFFGKYRTSTDIQHSRLLGIGSDPIISDIPNVIDTQQGHFPISSIFENLWVGLDSIGPTYSKMIFFISIFLSSHFRGEEPGRLYLERS